MRENYELIRAWVELRAPDVRTKNILLNGLNLFAEKENNLAHRAEKYPNEGNKFSEEDCAKLIKFRSEIFPSAFITNWMAYFDREKEIELIFGRPIKSLKNKLLYMAKKGAV